MEYRFSWARLRKWNPFSFDIDIYSSLFFTYTFAIAAFYLALLSKTEVMELQTISQFDIYSLIGIGLGVGTLGGFIDKPYLSLRFLHVNS